MISSQKYFMAIDRHINEDSGSLKNSELRVGQSRQDQIQILSLNEACFLLQRPPLNHNV